MSDIRPSNVVMAPSDLLPFSNETLDDPLIPSKSRGYSVITHTRVVEDKKRSRSPSPPRNIAELVAKTPFPFPKSSPLHPERLLPVDRELIRVLLTPSQCKSSPFAEKPVEDLYPHFKTDVFGIWLHEQMEKEKMVRSLQAAHQPAFQALQKQLQTSRKRVAPQDEAMAIDTKKPKVYEMKNEEALRV